MNNLWKKESNEPGAQYIDLFESVQDKSVRLRIAMSLDYFKSQIFDKDNYRSNELRREGNEKFRLKQYLEAMNLYNRSLCFAEFDTENVALAYANRSACFFHLQEYDKALIDIELAKNANLPKKLISKLDERKKQCLEKLAGMDPPSKYAPKLSYEANEKFPCLANVVEIKYNTEFGRHLVAKCDIPVGKTVLIEENFLTTRKDDSLICYTCFNENTNFIACQHCHEVVFCNVDCMNRNVVHKYECSTIYPFLDDDTYFSLKSQIQAVTLAIEAFSSVESLMRFVEKTLIEDPEKLPDSTLDLKSKYDFFFKLKLSDSLLAEHLINSSLSYEFIIEIPSIGAKFNTTRKKRFLMHLIYHHYLVIYTNSFEDISVANVLSMVNHSCAPNLINFTLGKLEFCMTIRPIKEGGQLFISYLSPTEIESSKEYRQQKLMSKWNFVCHCDKCRPAKSFIDSEKIGMDPCFQYTINNYHDEEKAQIVLENCVEFLNKYGAQWSEEIEFVIDVYKSIFNMNMN